MMLLGFTSWWMTCWRWRLQRGGDFRADVRHPLRREQRLLDQGQQRGAGDPLHDDVGLRVETRRGEEFRHVRTRQPRQDHLLDLEADDRAGPLAVVHDWDLHDDR